MTMRFPLAFFTLLVGTLVTAAEPNTWVTMFNGKTLEGWTQKNGLTKFHSRNGFISASPLRGGSGVSYLCTVGEFADFELELEVKLDSRFGEDFASAVQIRSHASTDGDDSTFKSGSVHGPQIRIAYKGKTHSESGCILLNSTDGKPVPLTRCELHSIFQKRSCNSIRFVAKGPRIQTFVNGKKVKRLDERGTVREVPEWLYRVAGLFTPGRALARRLKSLGDVAEPPSQADTMIAATV